MAGSLDRAQLEALVEHLPVGVIIAEAPSGRLVVANGKVREIWKRPFEPSADVAGYGAYHGFHADGRPYEPAEWPLARAISTGESVSEEEIVFERGDGSRGVMAVSAGPIRDAGGALVGGVVIFRDVTDERRAALRLTLLAELSRALAEPSDLQAVLDRTAERVANALGDSCVVLLLDESGTRLEPAATYHRDPARGELASRTLAAGSGELDAPLLGGVLREGRTTVVEAGEWDSDGLPASWAEALGQRSTGALALAPMTARGVAIGAIGVSRETADEPFTIDDAALLALLADRSALAIEAARLLGAERRSRAFAEEAVRSKDEMLRMIAHDLRNPLAVIQGYAELARRQLAAETGREDRVRDRLDKIAANARRMARQLSGLVDAALLRASRRLDLTVQRVDLRDLLSSLCDEYRACYADLNLELRLPAESLTGAFDTARMQSVFANLLDNAIKYSDLGDRIDVHAERRDGEAEIRVRDRGIGISAEDRGRIFDPFFRAANADGYPGLGLGLAGAAKVVEQHGGRIELESALGEGTTVSVRLPLSER